MNFVSSESGEGLREGQEFEVEVFGFYRDGGDGGGTFVGYRDAEHFIEELREDYDPRWDDKTPEEQFEAIESEDDPYENGEFDRSVSIKLVVRNGKLVLADTFSMHWGQ